MSLKIIRVSYKGKTKNSTQDLAQWLMYVIPALWEVRQVNDLNDVQDQPGQHGKTLSLLKNTNISWAWWCTPIIPATQEAEAGESLEPRRQRWQ